MERTNEHIQKRVKLVIPLRLSHQPKLLLKRMLHTLLQLPPRKVDKRIDEFRDEADFAGVGGREGEGGRGAEVGGIGLAELREEREGFLPEGLRGREGEDQRDTREREREKRTWRA